MDTLDMDTLDAVLAFIATHQECSLDDLKTAIPLIDDDDDTAWYYIERLKGQVVARPVVGGWRLSLAQPRQL